jgi:hypothetical protein
MFLMVNAVKCPETSQKQDALPIIVALTSTPPTVKTRVFVLGLNEKSLTVKPSTLFV